MRGRGGPRLFAIPPGAPFLPTLADALLSGSLIPGFPNPDDPLALADATIYVPTRRAARALRAVFAERGAGRAAILPAIRPLGEFEDDIGWFDGVAGAVADPPIDTLERRLRLAPLVHRWKHNIPKRLAGKYAEGLVVPASMADALWLADDLARLIDEVDAAQAAWDGLKSLASGELAGWWEVTLDFLAIVTDAWPKFLSDNSLSDPAAHRSAAIRAEAARLAANPQAGPVIAAGSTGSLAATAELLGAISRLEKGAVVLPGFDPGVDDATREALTSDSEDPTIFGHPLYGMAKLLGRFGVRPSDVSMLGAPGRAAVLRAAVIADSLRPAPATSDWMARRSVHADADIDAAFGDFALVEAGNERDEALAIAIALREAIETPGATAALVTPDRALARRVASELLRFGIQADDSGGTAFSLTPPGSLIGLTLLVALRKGDPATLLGLLKHPLLRAGMARDAVRAAAETIELVALRGGVGRPDAAALPHLLEARIAEAAAADRPPAWMTLIGRDDLDAARRLAEAVSAAIEPLAGLREQRETDLHLVAGHLARTLEDLAREDTGALAGLYENDSGAALAEFLRGLLASRVELPFDPGEAPEVFAALTASVVVKPRALAAPRVSIWGTLEARLQNVDLMVLGGLNEGVWPRQPEPGRFMSRLMKRQMGLDPPERQIGQSAHDFMMAAGAPRVVLSRSARVGDAPAARSRWLERLSAFLGERAIAPLRQRGAHYLDLAAALDASGRVAFAPRPAPAPALALRPKRFSVTEIETLRRDPYAIYARRVLKLAPLEPLLRDPGASERGTLMHGILAEFAVERVDPSSPGALDRLLAIGRAAFDRQALPRDVEVAWWPRFDKTARAYIDWERTRIPAVSARHAEAAARETAIGDSGVTLRGRADRIDILADGSAAILDFKTGATPSKGQAHTLFAPQLALEAALLKRAAFEAAGTRNVSELAHVRLKADGAVEEESILAFSPRKGPKSVKTAEELGEEAWARLAELLDWFAIAENGYRSRMLPMRESDVGGDYDHLARVLEWSAGGDGPDGEE